MEQPFFTTAAAGRSEAMRWLTIAEKLLSVHDLLGSKTFATRARDSDPTLSQPDEIISIVDALLAGDRRIGNNQPDWYAILRLSPAQASTVELINNQYRNLILLLNPQTNKFPYAEKAFRLVFDAWSVLSNPSRKSLYDRELAFYSQPPPPQPTTPPPQQHQQQPDPFNVPNPTLQPSFMFFGGGGAGGQPPLHGGESSSLGSNQYAQVHPPPSQVQPVIGGSTREPLNFNSGYDFAFGSGSGSKSSYETVNNNNNNNNQAQMNFSTFVGNVNVASASAVNQGQLNVLEKQNYSNDVCDQTMHNVNVREDIGHVIENEEDVESDVEEERVDDAPVVGDGSSFWTACPYCYYMYEYPGAYVDCTLRCQNCKRAFQAVVIPSPPPVVDGQTGYYCCWAFLPFGFSVAEWEKHHVASTSGWTPFSDIFSCPQMGNNVNGGVGGRRSSAPRDGDDGVVEISDSDDDWQDVKNKRGKKKVKDLKGKEAIRMPKKRGRKPGFDKGKKVNVQDAIVSPQVVELPNKATSDLMAAVNAGNQPGRVTKDFGRLDLNVELSIDSEEPAVRMNQGNGLGRGEDDNIEGNGFFEGLDEFLNSLPICRA